MTRNELNTIETRLNNAQKAFGIAYTEGRDHSAGSSFIMTGEGKDRGEDIELFSATTTDFDFIANAKQDIPKLLTEIRRLNGW